MLIINLIGLFVIALIIWWFWLYRPDEVSLLPDETVVTVSDGVYTPSRIKIASERPVTITFLRQDKSPCSEMVVFPDLEISENLPVNQKHTLSIGTLKKGTYVFHCQMQMYRGELHVE